MVDPTRSYYNRSHDGKIKTTHIAELMRYLLSVDRGTIYTHPYHWKNSDNNFSYV